MSPNFTTCNLLMVKRHPFQVLAKSENDSAVFVTEKDISCYIFQNITKNSSTTFHKTAVYVCKT